MTKIPKKAQVAFNQFVFDEMMNKMREVELLEKAHKRLISRIILCESRLVIYGKTIETLQIQMKNLIDRNNGLTNAVLKMQRARDAKGRYKKE